MKSEKKGSVKMEGNPDDVLKLDEVAILLRMTDAAIYTAIKNGQIPASKVCNKWRFNKRAVLEALNVRQVRKDRTK